MRKAHSAAISSILRRFGMPLTVLVLALICIAPGQVRAAALLYGQGLLWKIEGRGYAPSHLFGTMHSSDERVLAVPEPVLKAFDSSKRYIFELIVPEDGDSWTSVPHVSLPQQLSLRALIGDDAYNKVVFAAGRYGISTADLERLHPATVVSIFGQPAEEWRRRAEGWAFLDQALQNEARALGRPVFALERVEEQLEVMMAWFQGQDIGTLVSGMIEQSFKRAEQYEQLLQRYIDRDLDAIFDREAGTAALLPQNERVAYENFQSKLLDVRNVRMAKRAEQHLAAGNAFIAIGAAHLPGKKGVLHLLELRGFQITRIY